MGAAASRLLELARGLDKRGWQVEIISAMPNYPTGKIFNEYKGKFKLVEKVLGLKVIRYWIFASNSTKVFPRILNMLSFAISSLFAIPYLRKTKPEFILVESPPLMLGLTGVLYKKFIKTKFILNVADIWPLSALELNAIKEGYLYNKIVQLEKYIYKQSDLCLGQSEEIISHLQGSGAKHTLLFRNGVDIERFRNAVNGRVKENSKLVYAGLIGVAQGILHLCKNVNFKDLGLELHIFGDGAEKRELSNFLSDNPERNIFLHDPIKREDVPKLLVNYDAALIPLVKNIYGAVPSKIYEAMAAGLPILFSGNGEGASIIKKYEVGWVSKPGDFSKLLTNISEFVNDSNTAKHYRENGLYAAKNVFDREIQIDNLHQHLLSNLNN